MICTFYIFLPLALLLLSLISSAPRNGPAPSSVMSGEVAYRHFVFRFDYRDWKVRNRNLILFPQFFVPTKMSSNFCFANTGFAADEGCGARRRGADAT